MFRGSIAVLAFLATVTAACSSSEPDRVIVDEGTVPAEVTTSAGPATTDGTVPTTDLGPPTLDDTSAVTTAGIATVEFGMSVAEAEAAAGSHLSPVEGDASSCYVATFDDGPDGLTVTVSADTVERIDIVDGAIATLSGAGIGDTATQLQDLFGEQLESAPDPDGSGDALIFVPADEGDAGTRIIFAVDGDTVTAFRAGRRPIVDTGC